MLVNLATGLMKQQRYNGAREALDRAVQLDPRFAPAHERLGYCCFSQQRFEQALGHYERAIALDARLAAAHAGLGMAQVGMYLQEPGRPELRRSALEHWYESLALDPDQPKIRRLIDRYRRAEDAVAGPRPPSVPIPRPTGRRVYPTIDAAGWAKAIRSWARRAADRWYADHWDSHLRSTLTAAAARLGARGGDLGALEALLQEWPRLIEWRDDRGRTLLWVAASLGRHDAVAYLLAHGADLDASDNSGYTAIHLAARGGHTETVALLVAVVQ